MDARLALLTFGTATALFGSILTAQPVTVTGQRTVRASVAVSLVIPPVLQLRNDGTATFVSQRADTTTWTMRVEVTANLEWMLSVTAVDGVGARDEVRVQDHDGVWQSLGANGVEVATEESPADWRPKTIQIQVIGAAGRRAPDRIDCFLAPSDR
jgi:hypothetical protein